MRVLFWSETYWPRVGGVETLAVPLLAALRSRGFSFEVVTWGDAAGYEVVQHDGIPIHRFPFFARRGPDGAAATLEQVAQVAELKRTFVPDLVHLNSHGRSAWFHTASAARHARPTLLSLHQNLPDAAFAPETIAAQIVRASDAITCCSRAVYEATAGRAPGLASRLRVVPNALRAPVLAPTPPPHEPPTLVFVGRLVPEKGLDWALPALGRVLRTVGGARLLVVGEGPLRRDLEQRVVELGLGASVEFRGPLPAESVSQVLAQATAVVVPSLSEGFGLVALEAALLARPVVATRVGGLPEVVRHGETGWLIRPGDAAGLAAAARLLLEHPAESRRMGWAARQRALAEFRWDRYVDAFDELYRELASEPSARAASAPQRSREAAGAMGTAGEAPSFGTQWREGSFAGEAAFAAMRQEFQAAAAAHPDELCESVYRFADRPVRVRVVGRELHAQIVRPFSHLRVAEGIARHALQVDLWDASQAPGTRSWSPPGRTDGWHETTLQSADGRFLAQRLPHTFSCLDRERAELLGCLAWHDDVFIYERAKPFARLLLAWHNALGVQIVHAGLVARNGAGVLLAGKSGSGKSTTSLLCALSGLDFLAEDYVALERTDAGSFVGHSLYGSVFLNTQHLERFPQLASHAFRGRPPHEEKSVVLLSDVVPDALTRRARLCGLVFPELADTADAQLRPLSKSAALLALAPSSLLQIPNRDLGAGGFERLADLVQGVPCHRLLVGSDWASIPKRLDELIRSGDAASANLPGRRA